jgi:hypothetical protein
MRAKLALLLVSLGLSLAAAELALRAIGPRWVIGYPPACFWPHLFERYDPHGYRLRPARVIPDAYPPAAPRRISITANRDGFRSRRDFREPDPRPRVVVVGDSMVYGSGVEEPERFTELLEALEPGWRIDNLGMVAYGPDLMLRALEAVGLALDPTVVVFAIFSHDVYRVMPEASGVGFPLPRFTLVDGRLVTVPYPARPAWMRLRLVQGIRYATWRYSDIARPLNEAILDRFATLAAGGRFVPAVVFVPPAHERWDDRRRRRWLADWAAVREVAFFDLSAPLRAAGMERLYIPNDAHWNPAGHREVAHALQPFVARLIGSVRSPVR